MPANKNNRGHGPLLRILQHLAQHALHADLASLAGSDQKCAAAWSCPSANCAGVWPVSERRWWAPA